MEAPEGWLNYSVRSIIGNAAEVLAAREVHVSADTPVLTPPVLKYPGITSVAHQ